MKMGIAGFPGSGKTTIFNALSGIFTPKKKNYAEMSFVDFPDPPTEGGRLDEKVIVQMREVEALAHVVRAFDDPAQPAPDALRALESFRTELVVADLSIVERRIDRLKRERGKERERALLEKVGQALEAETELRTMGFSAEEETALAGFGFLTRKPRLVVLNVNESDVAKPEPAAIADAVAQAGLSLLVISRWNSRNSIRPIARASRRNWASPSPRATGSSRPPTGCST